MAYRDFSLRRVKQEFTLQLSEDGAFLAGFEPVQPSDYLQTLEYSMGIVNSGFGH